MSRVTISDIIRAVCRHYCLSAEELQSRRHDFEYSHPRQVGYLLCREFTPCSLTHIARRFGQKDHTTVRSGLINLKYRMERSAHRAEAQSVEILRAQMAELALEDYAQAHVRVWSHWALIHQPQAWQPTPLRRVLQAAAERAAAG